MGFGLWEVTLHHGLPTSRLKTVGLDSEFLGNFIYHPRCVHDAWHRLFAVLTVDEIKYRLGRYYKAMLEADLQDKLADFELVFGRFPQSYTVEEVVDHASRLIDERWTPVLPPEVKRKLSDIHARRDRVHEPGWMRQLARKRHQKRVLLKRRRQKNARLALEYRATLGDAIPARILKAA